MFINEKLLKKLMMKAYKGNGLYMARYDGYFYLSDAFSRMWSAKIAVGCMPKTILAAMVECAGEIPEEGEGWTSDTEKNQAEAFLTWRLKEYQMEKPGGQMLFTPVMIQSRSGTLFRILQMDDNQAFAVHPECLQAIDNRSVDRENEETNISGPFYDGDGGMYAFTNQAVWHVTLTAPLGTDEMIDTLSKQRLQYDEDV